ncbi:MAG: protein kinase [Pseudolysinimonas sp.]
MSRGGSEPPAIAGFTFLQRLGSGGFSDVYLYQQERPRRKVAVKVLVTEELTDVARDAFDAEANAMASLSAHSNIVSIYQADISDDGRPYFVMEYYGGPTLAESYKREPLGVVEVLRIGIRLAGAVATAHSQGILHRDIKPGNVLTNEYGALGLTDFGISSRVDNGISGQTTSTWALGGAGSTNGTESQGMSIPWSPPESFDDDPNPDVRSDLFSLAATIYTLLAGRTPFEKPNDHNSENNLVSRILRGDITPLSRTDVPSSLVAVLRKAMSVDRRHRFDDVVQFARALQRVEIELGYAETPIEAPNLDAPRSRPAVADDGDRTRARGITSIPAQQPVASSAPASYAPPPLSGEQATRIRSVPVIAQVPVAPPASSLGVAPVAENTVLRPHSADSGPTTPTEKAQPDVEPAAPRRRRPLAAILGVLAAVVVTVLVVVLIVHNLPTGAPTEPGQAVIGGDDPVLGQVVPTPVLMSKSASADGTSVTFTWQNPDPQPDDSYVWTRYNVADADSAPHPTTDPTATIDGVAPGTPTCVRIEIVRNGQGSTQPLEECVP